MQNDAVVQEVAKILKAWCPYKHSDAYFRRGAKKFIRRVENRGEDLAKRIADYESSQLHFMDV